MRFVPYILLALTASAQTRSVTDAEVARVHKAVFLIDSHNDVPSFVLDTNYDIGSKNNTWHTDISRMKAGGLGAQFFVVYVAGEYVEGNRSAHRALEMIDAVKNRIVSKYPNDFHFATSVKDIEEARKQGKIAALIGLEGGHAIEDSLGILRQYHALGVRYMTLTHSNTNNWADSSGDIANAKVKHHNGLTPFGKDVVREMNRLGIMVDISHVSDKTFWDALEVSKAPIFASHSSSRTISGAGRNMTDEMIVALAKKGGVVQTNFNCGFVSNRFREAQTADALKLEPRVKQEEKGKRLGEIEDMLVTDRVRRELGLTRASLAEFIAHIDHIKKIAGIDAIGIGSDFNGVTCVPEGLDDVSKYPNLTRALLERGYTQEDITKIYSGNILRVMRGVEAAAAK